MFDTKFHFAPGVCVYLGDACCLSVYNIHRQHINGLLLALVFSRRMLLVYNIHRTKMPLHMYGCLQGTWSLLTPPSNNSNLLILRV